MEFLISDDFHLHFKFTCERSLTSEFRKYTVSLNGGGIVKETMVAEAVFQILYGHLTKERAAHQIYLHLLNQVFDELYRQISPI